MALFGAAIRKDSVSLLSFPFHNHSMFSREMLLVGRLKRQLMFFFSLFFSGYCHSVSPRIVSIVSGGCNQSASKIFMWSLSRWIDASTLSSVVSSPLPPSLLDTYNLSMSSLGCNALCMVISILVLWSICSSSSLDHFKNGPEYLTRGKPRHLSLWQGSCQRVFISSNFLVLQRYTF